MKREQENLKWEGVLGSVMSTSTTVKVNFDSLKLMRLLSCNVQLALSFQLRVHCIAGETMEFPDL